MLARNGQVAARRWPRAWAAIASAPRAAELERLPGGSLQVDGVRLASDVDRDGEARLQARLVPRGARAAWLLGLGLGHLARELLARAELARLDVAILSRRAARASFEHADHTPWLADPRVELHLAEDVRALATPFAAAPACLRLADEHGARLRDQALLALDRPRLARAEAEREGELARRLRENADLVARDGDAAEMFGRWPGARVHVAAAGPTLAASAPALARRSRHEPLIAVDAALRPLLAAGARPDAVVTIDPHPEGVRRHFDVDLAPLASSALVYFPVVARAALERWPGRRLAAYGPERRYRGLARELPRAELFSSGSVLHPAVDLAVRAGAGEVRLHGADFGFPGGRTHAAGSAWDGAAPAASARAWVVDGEGRRLASLPNLIGYLRDLERYIGARPELRFTRTGAAGAAIERVALVSEDEDAARAA